MTARSAHIGAFAALLLLATLPAAAREPWHIHLTSEITGNIAETGEPAKAALSELTSAIELAGLDILAAADDAPADTLIDVKVSLEAEPLDAGGTPAWRFRFGVAGKDPKTGESIAAAQLSLRDVRLQPKDCLDACLTGWLTEHLRGLGREAAARAAPALADYERLHAYRLDFMGFALGDYPALEAALRQQISGRGSDVRLVTAGFPERQWLHQVQNRSYMIRTKADGSAFRQALIRSTPSASLSLQGDQLRLTRSTLPYGPYYLAAAAGVIILILVFIDRRSGRAGSSLGRAAGSGAALIGAGAIGFGVIAATDNWLVPPEISRQLAQGDGGQAARQHAALWLDDTSGRAQKNVMPEPVSPPQPKQAVVLADAASVEEGQPSPKAGSDIGQDEVADPQIQIAKPPEKSPKPVMAKVEPKPDPAEQRALKEADAWATVQQHDDVTAYEAYLAGYPRGRYAEEARRRLDFLAWRAARADGSLEALVNFATEYPLSDFYFRADEAAWQWVSARQVPDLFRRYRDAFPDGAYRSEALRRLTRLQREDAAWRVARRNNDEQTLRDYLTDFPQGRYIADAQEKLASIERERQLTEARAAAERKRAQRLAAEARTAQSAEITQVREIQQQLRALGFHDLPTDGALTSETRQAIWDMQKRVGLQQTGKPSSLLLVRLKKLNNRSRPELVRIIEPSYPKSAAKRGQEATVIVQYDVLEDGRVSNARPVFNNSSSSFAKAACRAAEKFRYRPGTVRGKPVVTRDVQYTFRFRLAEQTASIR